MNANYYPGEYEPPAISIWQRINRFLWVALVLTIVFLIISAFMPELAKQREERKKHEDLQRAIDEQRAIHDHMQKEVGWLLHEPDYLAIFARDKLNKMKDGETIFVLDPAKDTVITPQAMPAPGQSPKARSLN